MSTARLDFQNHRLASLALAALFVVSMTNSLRSASDRFDEMLHGDQYVSELFHLNIQTLQVIEVRTAAERAFARGISSWASTGSQFRGCPTYTVPYGARG
jgi:hypothetical protein